MFSVSMLSISYFVLLSSYRRMPHPGCSTLGYWLTNKLCFANWRSVLGTKNKIFNERDSEGEKKLNKYSCAFEKQYLNWQRKKCHSPCVQCSGQLGFFSISNNLDYGCKLNLSKHIGQGKFFRGAKIMVIEIISIRVDFWKKKHWKPIEIENKIQNCNHHRAICKIRKLIEANRWNLGQEINAKLEKKTNNWKVRENFLKLIK